MGPHVDNYSVFLVQSVGYKTWSTEGHFLSEAEERARELPGAPVRLLQGFEPAHTW